MTLWYTYIKEYIITVKSNINHDNEFKSYYIDDYNVIQIQDINLEQIEITRYSLSKIYNFYGIDYCSRCKPLFCKKSLDAVHNELIDSIYKFNKQHASLKNISKYIKVYYDNGNLNKEYYITNGKIEGPKKSYFQDGKIDSIFNYVDDKINGEYICYFNNTNINSKGIIINNEIIEKQQYDFDDKIDYEQYFKNGHLIYEKKYFNGKIFYECEYTYDKERGISYEDGKCITYHDNGNIRTISLKKNNVFIGEIKEFDENNNLIKTYTKP